MSIYSKFALDGSNNECAWTDTVFFPISQVCPMGVTLSVYGTFRLKCVVIRAQGSNSTCFVRLEVLIAHVFVRLEV